MRQAPGHAKRDNPSKFIIHFDSKLDSKLTPNISDLSMKNSKPKVFEHTTTACGLLPHQILNSYFGQHAKASENFANKSGLKIV